ncbi:MAG: peptide ABC transporter substrate-binding protein [Eubacteriaceae bacterium]|nr:peptide ABC transporter substrate-binding protein [Eubacteriaceae bacterium]
MKSYSVSSDGKVYTFTLRDDAKWSDGKAVTAADFVYSWQRLINPETMANYGYILEPVQNAMAIMYGEKAPSELGVKAIDEKTFQVTLEEPCSYFLDICAFPSTFPVRGDIIEANGDQWTFNASTYIGNGPYKMADWKHNSYIQLTKNENYYDYAKLGPASIKFTLMDDSNAMLAAYNSGELNFIQSVPVGEIKTLINDKKLTLAKSLSTYAILFNNASAPFDNAKVRDAFLLTIDRNYITDTVLGTEQTPASAFVPYGIFDTKGTKGKDFRTVGGDYYSVAAADYKSNCDKARALLKDAGYEGGKGFPVVEYMYVSSSENKAIAEALQNMWQTELGVTVKLVNQEGSVYGEALYTGAYQIAPFYWAPDYNDPISFLDIWVTDGMNNVAAYSNTAYDSLIQQVKDSSKTSQRMSLMHQAEKILIDDAVIAPVYFYTQPYMLNSNIKGMYYSPMGYFFFTYCTK